MIQNITIIFLIAFLTSNGNAEDSCHKLLRELAHNESSFAYCATVHSVPVSICKSCKNEYEDMNAAFAAIKNEPNCTSMYFDKDRVNIVAAAEEALARLWTKAYCDDCYKDDHIFAFDKKSTAFYGCLDVHEKDPCDNCLVQYMDLNNFYIQMDQHNNGEVCYDLQDSMNRTRNLWSKDKECCRREYNMTLFTVVISFVGFLPFLFYGGAYLLTKRQERNHGILNDEDPLLSSSAPSVSSAAAAATNFSTTSSTTRRNAAPQIAEEAATNFSPVITTKLKSGKLFNKFQEPDDSSDEENLAKKN